MEKIRILYIVDNLKINNGVSSVAMNYFRNINKSIFDIDFLVIGNEENYNKDTYVEEIKSYKGNIFYSNIIYSIKNIFKIKKFIKDFFRHNQYDIVELHTITLSYLLLNKHNFNNNEIRIMHTHSSIKSTNIFKNFINSILNFNIKQYADYYFGCSIDSGKYWFGKKIVDSDRFFYISNGTNIDKYLYDVNKRQTLRKQFDIEDKVAIGFVGRISKDKNLPFIINVMNKIPRNDIKLFLVGSRSNDYENVKQLIKDKKNIEYLGFRNDTYDIYNMFDCLVLCSKKEGLPMVVVEAQLNKLPCLLSDTITREVNIGLCKYLKLEESEWCNELKSILIDNKRKYDIDVDRFDIKKNVTEIEMIYKKIIERR